MPAYMIIAAKMHDREKFVAGYAQAVPPIVKKFGGEYVITGPGAELLEGSLEGYGSVAVSKWPDKETAKAFWNSPEYQEAAKLRKDVAEVQVLLVEVP